MKIITLGLALTFFVLALMVVAGSLNFFTSMKTEVARDDRQINCVSVSYTLEDITYENNILSFTIKHQNEFSNDPVQGIQIRSDNASVSQDISTGILRNGMSRRMTVSAVLGQDQTFYVSPLGCSLDYERLCHVYKNRC